MEFFAIIWLAIIIAIIARVIKRDQVTRAYGKSDTGATGSALKPHPSVSAYKGGSQGMMKPPSGGATSVYQGGISRSSFRAEKATHTLMENRNNDWLAEELRDEQRALYRTNIMFGQQMEHRQVCDAKMLKEFHLEHCSAGGADTGQMK
ncbi:MAG: hypothetical protein K6A38_04065 [Lachnospiraceae bacterium]|nr:hypothetical protein [Lachnospiraceae bacterium]